jgi:alcohol dehydrogenase class IV
MIKSQYLHRGKEDAGVFVHKFLSLSNPDDPLFMIAGKYSYELSGAASFFSSLLDKKRCVRFSEFSANPKINDLNRALDAFKNSKARLIISVGGGSAIDLAKLVKYFTAADIDPEECLEKNSVENTSTLPLLAVPTTAGTGSEATHFATLYPGLKKISIAAKQILPSHVWLNFEFTTSLSPYQTACTGFDALAQAIESYWAVASTHQSRQDSAKALQMCMQHLEGAVLTPTSEHRTGMLEAAYLAGKAIDVSKTTAAHALSYSLTAHYGLPHGHAVAMTLPAIFELNAATAGTDVNDPRGVAHVHTVMNELCKLIGADSPMRAARRIRTLMARIGLTDTWFSEHGFDKFKAQDIIMKEVNLDRVANNPRRLDRVLVEQIAAHIR